MSSGVFLGLCVVAVLAVAACDSAPYPSPPRAEPYDSVDAAVNVVIDSVVVDDNSRLAVAAFTVRNESPDTVRFATCIEGIWADLERPTSTIWERAGSTMCNGSAPNHQVPPGRSISGSIQVRRPGTFRIAVPYTRGRSQFLFARSSPFSGP